MFVFVSVQLQDAQQHMNHVAIESEELKSDASLIETFPSGYMYCMCYLRLSAFSDKLKLITEELEFERSLRSTSDLDNDNARIALHRQAAKNQGEQQCKRAVVGITVSVCYRQIQCLYNADTVMVSAYSTYISPLLHFLSTVHIFSRIRWVEGGMH